MNIIVWIVLGILAFLILAKNWDKIYPILKGLQGLKRESITLSRKDVENRRKQKIENLMQEREKLRDALERQTSTIRKKIQDIDIEIAILRGGN